MALAATALLIILPLQPGWAVTTSSDQENSLNNLELPSALADDDSFSELPFEQLRQALREEVERDPNKSFSSYSTKKYNLLIR